MAAVMEQLSRRPSPERSRWRRLPARLRLPASALLLIGGALLMAPHGDLFDTAQLLAFWRASGVMGLGFVFSWFLPAIPRTTFWAVAVLTRLLLLPMEPSDDIWRYIWEGGIQLQGFSPYHLPPDAPALEALRTPWWPQINHPDTTAIYPPLAQLLFRVHAALAQQVLLFKLSFLAADLAICGLLAGRFGAARTALYAWNPIVIYCISGGGHYDSWFLLPLVAGWLLAEREPCTQAPRIQAWIDLLLGLSVALKWITLPLLLHRSWSRWRQFQRPGPVLSTLLLGLTPLLLGGLVFCRGQVCPLLPTGSTFMRYGRSAEWMPHWVGQLWPVTLESNAVYGLLLVAVLAALLGTTAGLGVFAWRYLLALLLLSPVVHAWYFIWLMPFAVASQNWGARLVSLSAFVYFVLPSRLPDWQLSTAERLLLWVPLLVGLLLSGVQPGCERTDPAVQR
jgi:alpha-1,6-mannosyltransferase